VVATAVGAFREFLTDRVTARLVPPDDPASLAAAIGDLLEDREGAARLAGAARALAARHWSWAESARATLALYQAVRHTAGSAARAGTCPPEPKGRA
jgi:glycosyltransferase involved in cell wall biosynthesis